MRRQVTQSLKKCFPNLADKYIQIREEMRASKPLTQTPHGFSFAGNKAMEEGTFEPGETQTFLSLMSSIDIVVNVGANIGYYCCLALKSKKQVYAFEPMTKNVQCLLRNIHANNWTDRIEVYPMALGDHSGIIKIFGSGTGASLIEGWDDSMKSLYQLTPCSTLDKVIGNRLEGKRTLFMVDIEGAESFFLKGSQKMFDLTPKPIWFVEISISEHQPRGQKINPHLMETFEEFWSRDYEAWTTHNGYRLMTKEEIQNIIETGKEKITGDTFLFIDKNHHKDLELSSSLIH